MADRTAPGAGRIRAASTGRDAAGGERSQGSASFIARRAAEQIAELVLEVLLDANGDLISYRRTGRYVRGDVSRRCGR